MEDKKIVGRIELRVGGMSCRSCEVKIERALSDLPDVTRVSADATRGKVTVSSADGTTTDLRAIETKLVELGYKLDHADGLDASGRPSFWTIVGMFALVLLAGKVLGAFGLLDLGAGLGETTSFAAIFVLGLVAASSSCIAVSGGLLLSSVAKYRERYGAGTFTQRMSPVALFVGGRIASYAVLGGVIGAVGQALEPSPVVSGAIAVLAAAYMIVMGLGMLGIAPGWLKRAMPRMPKSISHRIMDAEGKEHPTVPFLLGAATFFLPCGFTQSLQLYALTTGSFVGGATALLAFALGTAPALLALGLASGSLKGKTGTFFFRFAGALVVSLGIWNVSNGFAASGHPLAWPQFTSVHANAAMSTLDTAGKTQTVDIEVTRSGYKPDSFTVKAGVPVVLNVFGAAAQGCGGTFTIPRLGVREFLSPTKTTKISFTPTTPGSYPYSCSMGMYRGAFQVIE